VEANVWERQRSPIVRGIEIVGSHEDADGIEASGTMQLIISEVTIRRVRHGIHLVNRNRNVIVSDCHIYDNRGIGVYYDAVNLHQSNIIGCHVSYNRGGGIVVRGGDVRNVHIGTCDIEGNMSPEGGPTANVLLDSTSGSIAEIAITGCTIQHAHEAPGSANIRINGRSTPREFTEELRHGNVTISGNVLSDVRINIDVQNARGVTIVGNTLWKGYDHDVRISGSEGVVVSGNVLDRNPRYHYGDGADARGGIVFSECDGCTISGNHLSGTGDAPAAIALQRCRRMNVTGCTVLDAAHVGLLLDDVSDSRVSGCLVRSDRPGGNDRLSLLVNGGGDNQISDNVWADGAKFDDAADHSPTK
ncbi:MAG: right-handed parallel beta-helix repeat-containing protein, partial [Planctomycetaceae bacterium]